MSWISDTAQSLLESVDVINEYVLSLGVLKQDDRLFRSIDGLFNLCKDWIRIRGIDGEELSKRINWEHLKLYYLS